MKIRITIDLAHHKEHRIGFRVSYNSSGEQNDLTLPALKVGNGVEVEKLAVTGKDGKSLQFSVENDRLLINTAYFQISYFIKTAYAQCVGCDKDIEFIYPFISSNEVFLGTGSIAVPTNLEAIADTIEAGLHISNLPPGWRTYSNLVEKEISPASLDMFFIYCSTVQEIHRYKFSGKKSVTEFQLCVQAGKEIPAVPHELWNFLDAYCTWLEDNLAPLLHIQTVNTLILQAPDDFEALSNGRSFATGENMLHGIAVYAPTDPAYLEKLFHHSSYEYFLHDGLAHEMLHYYTTGSWQGRYKSLLSPASDCPPDHIRLIGESLNVYFHSQFMSQYFTGSDKNFITETIARAIATQQQSQKPNPLIRLFSLDRFLYSVNSSLLELFRQMIQTQRAPYHSVEILIRILKQEMQIELPEEYLQILLGTKLADIKMIETALIQTGYILIQNGNEIQIERSA